jgi:hypothetical protein
MIFAVQSVCGYLAWLLCFGVYVLPRLKSMDPVEAQRVIATLHSFRFFGLVVLLPGIVDPNLPLRLTSVAGYWDLATGVLAIITLMTVRIRPDSVRACAHDLACRRDLFVHAPTAQSSPIYRKPRDRLLNSDRRCFGAKRRR